jgi:hypothetical protein
VQYTYYNNYVKFEGVQRRLKFNKYFFKPLSVSERELNLNSVWIMWWIWSSWYEKSKDWFNEKQRRIIEDYI